MDNTLFEEGQNYLFESSKSFVSVPNSLFIITGAGDSYKARKCNVSGE
jgi:hypothetical protein